jgi:hypothetical protein
LKVTYTEEAIADIVDAITPISTNGIRPLPRSSTLKSRVASSGWPPANSMARFLVFAQARSCAVGVFHRCASTTSAILMNC